MLQFSSTDWEGDQVLQYHLYFVPGGLYLKTAMVDGPGSSPGREFRISADDGGKE